MRTSQTEADVVLFLREKDAGRFISYGIFLTVYPAKGDTLEESHPEESRTTGGVSIK